MTTDVAAVEARATAPTRRVRRAAASVYAAVRSNGLVGQVVSFTWHFVQMAVVMMLGMAPLGVILSALGQSNLGTRSPEAYALAMLGSMVLPMAAFMLIRGHSWERTVEMSGAMTIPTAAIMAGSLLGLIPQRAALTVVAGGMGIPMWAAMLGAMLFRWRDYAQHRHGHVTTERPEKEGPCQEPPAKAGADGSAAVDDRINAAIKH